MTKIIISEFIDAAALASLTASADVTYNPNLVDDEQTLAKFVSDADALIVRNRTQVRGPLLEAAANLQVVGRLGVGLDNIDVAACEARGIEVIPATGANAAAVAEYVIAAMLVLLRPAYLSSDRVLNGEWPRQEMIGGEIGGRTLGLLGFGSIAREVARRATALDMAVVAHDPFVAEDDPAWQAFDVAPTSFDDILTGSDAISVHLPLTDQTSGLLDEDALSKMKNGAVLINTARGGIVDEAALAGLLRAEQLGGAAIDVFEKEPLAAGSPLAGCPKLIATPHIAGVTDESNVRVGAMIADRVLAALGRE